MKFKTCTKCKRLLPVVCFGKHTREKDGLQHMCKDCEKKYRQQQYKKNKRKILDRNKSLLNTFPWRRTFYNILQRCNNSNNAKYYCYGGRGIKCLITEDELKELWFRDKAYDMDRPSIDRIDNDGNYTFENCRYIELSDNTLKRVLAQQVKAVYQLDLKGNIIKEFISISEATRQTGITNISKVVRGICHTVGGFKWRYA